MAADYSPNMTWPTEKLALQKKILGYEGIHVTFENGRRYPTEDYLQSPSPQYVGYTFRVFCYSGDLSSTNFVGPYNSRVSRTQFFYIKVVLKKQDDKHAQLIAQLQFGLIRSSDHDFGATIPAHDIYSLGFRVESPGYIAVYLDDTYLKSFHVGTIFGYEWSMWMQLESHTVLSYHFSQETNNPFTEPSRGYLNGVPMGIGSYAECSLIFNGPGRDLQVTQSGSSITFSAPDTLAPGEMVQCILRISYSGYVVSTSFDDMPRAMAVSSPQYLEPTFSGDFSLRKAHTHAAD